MALKRRNKVDAGFSMASMSDLVFLLLIFFMITSTQVAPNALKLLLPQSNNQTVAKAVTTISITADLKFYINQDGDLKRVAFSEIEPYLQRMIKQDEETYIALHADKTVPIEQVVNVMNIAKRHQIKMILATAPEE
jgi:biopolymer transport protein ExbD